MRAATPLLLLAAVVVAVHANELGKIEEVTGYKPLKRHEQSTLYEAEHKSYAKKVLVAHLRGSHYQVGYAYGALLGNEILKVNTGLIDALIPKNYQRAFFIFLDWQWSFWLGDYYPPEYLDELRGMRDGGAYIGVDNLDLVVARAMVLASFPGDKEKNLWWLFVDELEHVSNAEDYQFDQAKWTARAEQLGRPDPPTAETVRAMFNSVLEMASSDDPIMHNSEQCSFWSAWGPRTKGGTLWTGRNLDWSSDTGIAEYKLLAIFHVDGKIPNAAAGFPGMLGALVGLSEQGISVGEAGEDVRRVTFRGAQWTVRLRHVMENCKDCACALKYWSGSGNTMGMNHLLSCDADTHGGHPGHALETMMGYTAVFTDADTREETSIPHAVFRTNHAYDPKIREQECHPPHHPSMQSSMSRYDVIRDGLLHFEKTAPIGAAEAVWLTAAASTHGPEPHSCYSFQGASNVLSVAMDNHNREMYAAWEEGTKASWSPAACNPYLHFDLKPFFTGKL